MQRKAYAKLIAHQKAINKHWKPVSYWTNVDEEYRENDDENPEPMYREYAYHFTPQKYLGTVFSKFERNDTLTSIFFRNTWRKPNFGSFPREDQ